MSEQNEKAQDGVSKAEAKKEAEGQGMYHLYCDKCGHQWYSSSWDNYCPKWGCTGRAHRI